MNIALWVVQGLLAVVYGLVGGLKTFAPGKVRENAHMTWAHGQSDSYIRWVGIPEILGALGLVLPMVTGVLPWLTPLAAVGLMVIQLLAIFTVHLPRKEPIMPSILFIAFSLFIIFGRWELFFPR